MSSLGKHVIRQPKPYRYALIVVIAVVLTATSVWHYLTGSTDTMQTELSTLKEEQEQLSSQYEQLLQQTKALQQELEDKNQSLAIQKATDQQLQHRLDDLQNKVVYLNKELIFYQGITQGNTSSKLQIRELKLSPNNDQPDTTNYRIVVTQGENITKPITGTIQLTLNYDKGKPKLISEHQLNLRHVQIIEGTLKLEDNVTPKSITVSLTQNKKTTLTETFEWQTANQN